MGRNYSTVASATTLQADITSGANSMALGATTGFPAPPFVLVIDPGATNEEAVLVTAMAGNSITAMQRAYSGTPASPHTAGAAVRHMLVSADLQEAGDHAEATGGVHGVSGDVVGTTDTQSLDNKTFASATGGTTPLTVAAATSQTPNVMEMRDGGGVVRVSIDKNGKTTTAGLSSIGQGIFTPNAAGIVPLITQGLAGQTARLFSARTSEGTERFGIDQNGRVQARGGTFKAQAVGDVALVAQGMAGQTANAFEVQNNATTVNAYITHDGNALFSGSLSVGEDVTLTKATTPTVSSATGLTVSAGTTGVNVTGSGGLKHNNVPVMLSNQIARGVASVTIASGQVLSDISGNIAHGLPSPPTAILLTVEAPNAQYAAVINGIGTSTFNIRIRRIDGGTQGTAANINVHWMAIL